MIVICLVADQIGSTLIGAAAKVIMGVDRLWEKVRPSTFGDIKVC